MRGATTADTWLDPTWLHSRWPDVARATRDHLLWTVAAFTVGLIAATALVMLGRRSRRVDQMLRAIALVAGAVPAIGVVAGLMPTIRARPTLIAMVSVSVAALIYRGSMHALDRVDPDVVAEAIAQGYGRWSRLSRVEFPLALLAIRSSVRSAAVAAVGLLAIGGETLDGGLGKFVRDAWQAGPRTKRVVGLGVLVLLCVFVDGLVRLAIRPARTTRPTPVDD
jgi:osmoprotectant transport system permease protein